jgi:DNA-binding transcriptional LysR family regulator
MFASAPSNGRDVPTFRDAAESLGVTESAISHQVRRLEDFLHTALFDRSGPGVRLTPAGRRYLDDIDPAIRQIQSATDALLGPSGRRVVRLTLAPSLALNWLIPRLGAFEREHPDIELQLVTTTRVLDLQRDQIDLALRHGEGAWPGVKSTFLLAETVVPVCAPGYLTWQPEEDPLAALRRARLLVSARSPDEWRSGPGRAASRRRRSPAPSSWKARSRCCRSPRAAMGWRSGDGRWSTIGWRAGCWSLPSAPMTPAEPPTTFASWPTSRRPPRRGRWRAGCANWLPRLEFHSSCPDAKSLVSVTARHYLRARGQGISQQRLMSRKLSRRSS